jgi:phage terminase large subunit-like protein
LPGFGALATQRPVLVYDALSLKLRRDLHFYVLDDLSIVASPEKWAKEIVDGYDKHRADRIIGEVNNGGDLVEAVLRTVDENISYTKVTATRGKAIRAEPIAALYEQGRVHHVGSFPELEDQMCDFDPSAPGKSPDRMDALVWALTELLDAAGTGILDYYSALSKTPKTDPEMR